MSHFLEMIEAVGRVVDPSVRMSVASATDLSGSLTRRPTNDSPQGGLIENYWIFSHK